MNLQQATDAAINLATIDHRGYSHMAIVEDETAQEGWEYHGITATELRNVGANYYPKLISVKLARARWYTKHQPNWLRAA